VRGDQRQDFGLSKWDSAKSAGQETFCGTIAWAAPEVLREEPASPAADVYSFGVVLNEVANRLPPFSVQNPEGKVALAASRTEIVTGVAGGTLRPFLADSLPFYEAMCGEDTSQALSHQASEFWEGYRGLVHSTWAQDATQRPDMGAVLEALVALEKVIPFASTAPPPKPSRPALRRTITPMNLTGGHTMGTPVSSSQSEVERTVLNPDELTLEDFLKENELYSIFGGTLTSGSSEEPTAVFAKIFKTSSESASGADTGRMFETEDRCMRRLAAGDVTKSFMSYFGTIEVPRKALVFSQKSGFVSLAQVWQLPASPDETVEQSRRAICDTWFGVIGVLDALTKALHHLAQQNILLWLLHGDMVNIQFPNVFVGDTQRPQVELQFSDSVGMVCTDDATDAPGASCAQVLAQAAATNTYAFVAPEIFTGSMQANNFTTAVSYAFGMMAWSAVQRCLTGECEVPFANGTEQAVDAPSSMAVGSQLTGLSALVAATNAHARPRIHEATPAVFCEVIRACWRTDPEARPSLPHLTNAIDEISDMFS
jgi:Protein kinase domain